MSDEKLMELQAEVFALRQIVWMMLRSSSDMAEYDERLKDVEDSMRKQNVHSRTIEILRSYREAIQSHDLEASKGSDRDK